MVTNNIRQSKWLDGFLLKKRGNDIYKMYHDHTMIFRFIHIDGAISRWLSIKSDNATDAISCYLYDSIFTYKSFSLFLSYAPKI